VARTGTPPEATQDADVILLAVHWSRMDAVLHQVGNVSGKVNVTCSPLMNADNTAFALAPPRRARSCRHRSFPG
jgi:8-hydroxy-5-deazaflavin:NADPH oxidoreductase